MFPGIKQALDNVLNNTSGTSEDHAPCVQLIRQYFCDFYFPKCSMDTGVVIPVCIQSCNLLFNNEECRRLLIQAIDMMGQRVPVIRVTPSRSSCKRTYVPIVSTAEPPVANSCISIEG